MIRVSIVLVITAALFTGCKDKGSAGAGGAAKATEGDGKPAALKLAKLGLQLDIAGEATAGDGIGDNSVMVQGGTVGALQVELAKTPQSVDEAKSDAGMYNPKHLKAETLADGWLITFDNTGSGGANYFVQSRRDIGGKTYACATPVGEPSQAAAAVAACKSLRK